MKHIIRDSAENSLQVYGHTSIQIAEILEMRNIISPYLLMDHKVGGRRSIPLMVSSWVVLRQHQLHPDPDHVAGQAVQFPDLGITGTVTHLFFRNLPQVVLGSYCVKLPAQSMDIGGIPAHIGKTGAAFRAADPEPAILTDLQDFHHSILFVGRDAFRVQAVSVTDIHQRLQLCVGDRRVIAVILILHSFREGLIFRSIRRGFGTRLLRTSRLIVLCGICRERGVLGFLGRKGNQIIEGSAQRFIDRLRARGAASEHRPCKNHMSLTIIDEEEVKRTALEIMEEKGVEVLLYTFFADAIREGDAVKGVVVESKAGREAILAKTVIDCTGDGDVAFRAGVECRKGDAEGGMQPPTLMFCMKGVDVQRLRDAIVGHPDVYDMDVMPPEQFRTGKFITVGLRTQIRQAQAAGYRIPVARTILITGLADDEIWVNMSRVSGVDSTRPESYTYGEIEGRKQIYEIARYLREFVPGFADARIEKVAPFMGIRESRVIVGRYVLTAEDIIACRRFGDAIAVAGYPVDIHHAKGGDCTMHFCDDSYDIPYRCLLPERVAGLLVAGRCSSMNHEAMASTRVMSTCMALGEAAGRAARLALKAGVQPADLDVEALRAELRATGAYLG